MATNPATFSTMPRVTEQRDSLAHLQDSSDEGRKVNSFRKVNEARNANSPHIIKGSSSIRALQIETDKSANSQIGPSVHVDFQTNKQFILFSPTEVKGR